MKGCIATLHHFHLPLLRLAPTHNRGSVAILGFNGPHIFFIVAKHPVTVATPPFIATMHQTITLFYRCIATAHQIIATLKRRRLTVEIHIATFNATWIRLNQGPAPMHRHIAPLHWCNATLHRYIAPVYRYIAPVDPMNGALH